MNTPKTFSILLVSAFILNSCATDNDDYVETPIQTLLEQQIEVTAGSKTALILPASNDFSAIPNDANNSITNAKVVLGQLLFHETALGKNPNMEEGMNTYSCASCHHAAAGFQSGIQQGIGEGGIGFGTHGEGRHKSPNYIEDDLDIQPIKSPSVLNTAYQKVMLWNGQFGAVGMNVGTEANWTVGTPKEANTFGFEGVETQAIAGLDVHRLMIEKDFIINSDYKALFDAAFPNVSEDERYTKLNGALAIAAYERTVLANEAPFQKWLKGDDSAMSEDEIEGAMLFFGKGQCYSCHSGPGLNGMEFHALGMKDLAGNNIMTEVDEATKKGRGGFTGNPDDDYKFKTPQLYNLMDAGFFGHGSSFSSIRDIISYKNNAVAENNEVPSNKLSLQFQPLNLTEDEIDLLTSFVENALYDANLKRYQPESLPTGSCFPNADTQSSMDMGCI
ncbi:cytochrome-c peroxidase [Hyunsoonleella sp. SJ7]|uniref:Cytochrome-c peroxidase n=1 Tax=Hyunsoonleella aquatilis TaxID=2762758 RepID=A0A923H718_9FLAO|nr:cytochrome c peroxidase [Hyunsoonleella aquatilis]MBC3756880.1 cytochrome-c peroxidase [Hyunsoonleella aquatilis]